ncbi:PEP-CTERM-box response regulator transcription factor [Moritella viscosa]|uniref:Two component, sigma54 specific, transcriptional regulator, Fis family protein n=1 Tax=Moritella viscosa TaxID=80854 RepID=A0A090ID53_9GAMM|nr:PEP-CTERM-box response regulator transcription factor [Moritella viscosa]CED59906.1 sigma-54 dependent response regulator [Moritella viscosa]SGY87488.1 Two component, sigma54 specific, transcriptional regulator, Fis family protein [Moritella viscosa]SGY90596.1 Two component, sigma54 specific, transcriptional regulator, Fis family protein [Moritella viscosa]SGY93205.1 Two component, sigma54 specific, transcriptional regulator, Fis family protein [Moritella viscosa]SGY93824.1 Two component, s
MQKNITKTLLIVEDDIGLQTQLKWHFSNYNVVVAANVNDAIAAIRLHEPQVMVQDLGLPPEPDGVIQGFKLLQQSLRIHPHMKLIVMTGNDCNEHALKAVSLGAYDFYSKPAHPETLELIVQRAFHMHQLESKNRAFNLSKSSNLEGLITTDDKMLKLCKLVEKVAPTNAACLLLGESGTGKEVLAKALHTLSTRNEHPFVAINCAALPENLFESELFGYEKGAFTGAVKSTPGKFELANGGTVFLDEIGEMPLQLQAKLLRFLQEKVIERVGGRKLIHLDTRIVCATNRNLEDMMANATFREDLYYRIAEIQIEIPPLRDRSSDKTLLARYLLKKYVHKEHLNIVGLSEEAINAIEEYSWPGNIRELSNKITRAAIMCDDKYISAEDLGLKSAENTQLNLKVIRESAEKNALKTTLSATGNNISAAAKLLGVTRPTLYDLMKKHNLDSSLKTNLI